MSWVKDSAERRAQVLQSLRDGHAYSQAAASAGITRQTLFDWRKADKQFADECAIAESHSMAPVESKIRQIALKAEDEALSFQACKTLLERRAPTRQDYAPVSHNHPFQALQLNVLAQVAPPLMQLGAPRQAIEGEVMESTETA